MELKKIKYRSAVFFGAMGLLITFLLGLLKLVLTKQDPAMAMTLFGASFGALSDLVSAPLIAGISAYLYVVVAVLIYNFVAKKYPISWEVKK